MKIRLTATTVWNVNPRDEATAKKLIERQPEFAILDFLEDAAKGDKEFQDTLIRAKEVEV